MSLCHDHTRIVGARSGCKFKGLKRLNTESLTVRLGLTVSFYYTTKFVQRANN